MAPTNGSAKPGCIPVPQFDRLNYFYGQMLGAGDFRLEQTYFREKMKLHNRCLHGYGTVCGLHVVVPDKHHDCPPQEGKHEILIHPGLALDAEGNELVIRHEDKRRINLWNRLSDEERAKISASLKKDPHVSPPVYVLLHYRQCGFEASRPVVPNPCGDTIPDEFGKVREEVRIEVTLNKPKDDERCETCCEGPRPGPGLLVARIDGFNPDAALTEANIHNEVRRRIGVYPLTTITGVNWRHGGRLSRHATGQLLKNGLVINFSRPVLTETIRPGVIDVYHVETRHTRNPNIIELRGEIGKFPENEKTTLSLRYHFPELEDCPEHDDRLLVVLRSAFLLDECCRPVDGLNVGGRVPYAEDPKHPGVEWQYEVEERKGCDVPPWGYAPWASGNGSGGGTFESWFYVEKRVEEPTKS